jgi:hypothetical protein
MAARTLIKNNWGFEGFGRWEGEERGGMVQRREHGQEEGDGWVVLFGPMGCVNNFILFYGL